VLGLLVERKRKKKKWNGQGAFFPGPDMLCWLCCMEFSQLLGAINSTIIFLIFYDERVLQ
jgi:hypothetical protein